MGAKMLSRLILAALVLVPALAGSAVAGAGGTFGPPDAAVPEPASLALLAGGVATLFAIRRRRK
jgi:peptidoglycan/LPS O-acetylase OafA/YrhL